MMRRQKEVIETLPRVVWAPLPGSQSLAVSCPCHRILYEGTRGPGKTDAQLMFFRGRVGLGYGRFWQGVIFDREYKNLDDLVEKSQRWFSQFGDGAKFLASKSDYRWVWPTGEQLRFRQIKKIADYWNYHGQEFPFIGWNELTKYPTRELYDKMMSCNRSSFRPEDHPLEDGTLLPEIPLTVFATTNPYGPGHNWVKRDFIDVAPPGVVVKSTTSAWDPRTKERVNVVKTQVRLFGSYKENQFLSKEYVAELEGCKDTNLRRAWLWGDWDIVAGGAFDDVWDASRHVVPRFKVPANWVVDRSMDWGSSHPFSIGWWATANGEEVILPGGKVWCPPKGSLIRIAEWYGSEEIGTNRGLKLSASAVANGIKEREELLRKDGWISSRVQPGPADNQIHDQKESDVETIAKKMEDRGVYWTRSNKGPGSRKQGLELLRDRLCPGHTSRPGQLAPEAPTLYVMDNCRSLLATLPVLPRNPDDPDDVDTDAEDHIYDDVRYRVLAGSNRTATRISVAFPT